MEPNDSKKLTPMMEQWHQAKVAHPDAILLFRMGDFYELFDNDAMVAAPILDLALTCRDKDKSGMRMAGFPFHAADVYVEKLVAHGFKVAICEQLEDPKYSKGIVKRGITNVVTPGTALIGESSPHDEPTYLLAIHNANDTCAIAALDLQSSQFMVTSSTEREAIVNEITRLMPREIVVPHDDEHAIAVAEHYVAEQKALGGVRLEKRLCTKASMYAHHAPNVSLSEAELAATAIILTYVKELKGSVFAHIGMPKRYALNAQLMMDDASRRNLDLIPKKKGDRHNLFSVLNNTKTVVGRRALYSLLMAPSTSRTEISERLDIVDELFHAASERAQIREELQGFYDLEKLLALACAEKITPRGLAHLRDSLRVVSALCALKLSDRCPKIGDRIAALPDFTACKNALEAALVEEPPLVLKDGGVFKMGFDAELDAVNNLVQNGKEMLLALEAREREATRIASLKIKYTRVFGYYIEITKTHLEKVPAHYQRKQTIANGERFVTPELLELETRLNSAEETALAIEEARFRELREHVVTYATPLLSLSQKLGALDILAGFADKAHERSWVRPTVHEASTRMLDIAEGRHPLIEEMALSDGTYFVPNDIFLDADKQRIALITGPNMAGKSTIMRQTALIQIMAQVGCFVPAKAATISLCDAIFARVGASDDPAQGRSTFMVEMTEAAAILSNATASSLIILDEIGRGTSTYDGMSIATAVCEYLHDHVKARTLFATHYHELTKLEERLGGLRNFHVGVEEKAERIRFLYCLRRGPCLKSFGIEVARLSGLPKAVLDRAVVILNGLEGAKPPPIITVATAAVVAGQVTGEAPDASTSLHEEIARKVLTTDINRTTPLQALNKISAWQSTLRKGVFHGQHHQGSLALR